MGMVIALFAALVLVHLGPDIPLRRTFHRQFVETPAGPGV